MMKSKHCLHTKNKGFVSIYALIVLQIVLMAISLFSLRIATLQEVIMTNSSIDIYIIQSIKTHIANQDVDEGAGDKEKLLEEDSSINWQEVYHGQVIFFSRQKEQIKIRYQHHHIVCVLNEADEIMRYEYI